MWRCPLPLSKLGMEVTLVEKGDRILPMLLGNTASKVYGYIS